MHKKDEDFLEEALAIAYTVCMVGGTLLFLLLLTQLTK